MSDICVQYLYTNEGNRSEILLNNLTWWDVEEDESVFVVKNIVEEWFKNNNIPLRYSYLRNPDNEEYKGYLSIGIEFWFDNPSDAVWFKMEWG